MNRLSTSERAKVIGCLCEGMSINSTVRMLGISKPTILKLVKDLGKACRKFHDARVKGLQTLRVQCDEIWAFCYAKKANLPERHANKIGFGDTWTWTALDADSKLMIEWTIGTRDSSYANDLMSKLAPRLVNRVQITTDGHHSYKGAIGNYFDVETKSDYAQCVKLYDDVPGQGKYSPGDCTGVDRRSISRP